MGCSCSCQRVEDDQRFSACCCCQWRSSACFCCGLCSVAQYLRRQETATSPQSESYPQSAGLLDRTSSGFVYPAIPNLSGNFSASAGEGAPENLQSNEASEAHLVELVPNRTKESTDHQDGQKKGKDADSLDPIILSEEDDNCPICLDEYDLENPKINTSCEHHFHLGCILEWMERSDSCPICDKEMTFNESP